MNIIKFHIKIKIIKKILILNRIYKMANFNKMISKITKLNKIISKIIKFNKIINNLKINIRLILKYKMLNKHKGILTKN